MNVYTVTFSNPDGTTATGTLTTDVPLENGVTLSTEFWPLQKISTGGVNSGYPSGNVPGPPVISVSQAIPGQQGTTGTPFSVNLSSYATGSGVAGATWGVNVISGSSLAALGLSFNASTHVLSGATPIAGADVLQLQLTSGAYSFTSNQFNCTITVPANPDTLPPASAPAPTSSGTVGNPLVVKAWVSMDAQTAAIAASGMASLQWQRATVTGGSVGSFSNVGSAVSLAVGLKLNWTAGLVGTPAGSNSCQQNADASFSFSLQGGVFPGGTAADSFAYAATPLSGNFDFLADVLSWTNTDGYAYDSQGILVSQDLTATGQRFGIRRFTPAGGVGVASVYRLAAGGSESGSATIAASVPSNVRCWINRTGNVLTAYFLNAAGVWTQIDQQTLTGMTDPVYLMVYGNRGQGSAGPTTTPQISNVIVSTAGQLTLSDNTVSSATSYVYQTVQTDIAGNSSTSDQSVTLTTPGGSTKNWNPGHYMSSNVYTTLGNKDNGGNPAASEKANEISIVRGGPSQCLGWEGYYYWRAIENAQGVYDFTVNGCGLDRDYVQCVSGSTSWTDGQAFPGYSSPRRFCLYILYDDFFANSNPAARAMPQYILNSASYGAGASGGTYGWWTQNGSPAYTGVAAAIWRSAVNARVQALYAAIAAHTLPDGYTVANSPYVEWIKGPGETAAQPAPSGSDASFTESGFITQWNALMVAAKNAFIKPNVASTVNYSLTNQGADTMTQALLGVPVAASGPDTFGYSAGQSYTNGLTVGQYSYIGGFGDDTNLQGKIPFIGTVQNSELVAGYGFGPYTPSDIVQQANYVKMTHLSWQYGSGVSPTGANWLGSASSLTQWLTNPGSWGGVLDTIYNTALTQSAYPTAYP